MTHFFIKDTVSQFFSMPIHKKYCYDKYENSELAIRKNNITLKHL